ncbi:conserved hypothetical protein [Methylobacterium sp. 4-46]|uniref:PIN domain-containing protein n=1 Tax=unclassified Methylobacterium TaxID=2615210 RepID=UPI000152E2F6|nr:MULTISPECIES: PIN domain-containing protein [Methylobacterium]ACA15220.1 conserved hypothetical protein [Methylobacterium sp. 4-46]WFT80950.1 PIN domain-containing protein [Methylobacterium nodulans]
MSTAILLDTQLLVLLVVGRTSKGIVAKHKNLTEFTAEDFDLLLILLGDNPALILLPNTVSEAANLLRQHRDPERTAILRTFAEIIGGHAEHYVASRKVVVRREYARLGITDSAILEIGRGNLEILTADLDLFLAAVGLSLRATNFNHKREEFDLL